MPRLVALDMLCDLVPEHFLALLETHRRVFDHESLWKLSCCVIRDLYDGYVGHGGVREEVRFKFRWGNLQSLFPASLSTASK